MRSLYIFLFLFLAQGLLAQHTFQRIYEVSDRQMIHGGMAVASDGGFYLVNIYQDISDAALKFHVTRHHLKGDVLWAYDYEVEGFNFPDFDFDIIEIEDKGVVIAATELNPIVGIVGQDILLKLDSTGEVEWSKTFDAEQQDAVSVPGVITVRENFSGGFVVSSINSDNNEILSNTYMASINGEGNAEWSRMYKILDAEGEEGFSLGTAIDRCMIDTTYMITGVSDTTSTNGIYISKLDEQGEMIWSRSYLQSLGDGFNTQALDIACANDTTTTVTGIIQNQTTNQLLSYVFKVDKDGLPLWSNIVQLPGSFPINLNTQIIADGSNNIVVAGRFLDAITGDLQDYVVRFNSQGEMIWSRQFPRIESYVVDPNLGFLVGGELRLNDAEYMLSGTAANLEIGSLYPFVVRMDQLGNANCEEDAMAMINDTLLTFTHDTLFWSAEDYGVFEDTEVEVDTFMDYDLPMVTLLDTFFCPQDPVEVTLDATADFAVSYEWSTGETTPTLDVTEEGEYMVTVTFDTLTCFTLCDTSIITVLEFPELNLIGDNSDYCETGIYNIVGSPSMGLPPFTFEWSTGETTQTIPVDVFGNYSLTVTDGCGNTAAETISYGEENLPDIDPEPGLSFNKSLFCESGVYEIGIFNSQGVTDIVWSSGETDVTSITVPGPGNYSVSFVICQEPRTLTIDENGFVIPPLEVTTMIDNSSYCQTNRFAITVDVDGGTEPYEYIWTTGDEVPVISVEEVGTYDVTITDSCMDMSVASITITEDDIPEPSEPILSVNTDSFCTTNTIVITFENVSEFINVEWSNGASNVGQIIVDEVGEYTVTALSCDQEVSATETVSVEDGVEFPNVFFPLANDTPIDQTFGPYVACPQLIDDYEMKIFNRWGKMVFETDNVGGRWNGSFDSKALPSAVFHWYARYTDPAGEDVIVEGDVTLIRN